MISRKATPNDIPGILALQAQNLISELSEEQKATNGFVTTPFTPELLDEIIGLGWAFVTEIEGQIVAYLFGGSWPYYEKWPIFPYMTSRFLNWKFKEWEITNENSFQYGPVCIDANHRGKQIINHLFEAMRKDFIKAYPLAATFINQANLISTKAHLKLGWTIEDEFEYNNSKYYGLAYDMSIPVALL
ncbi:MAG: GNAT family acetyltransferase [Reichenbachiella sp.]|uniref:GNAT family N-acetyltransferase n=1 Tax=Reichenbachiella sp. TaxID=2184521 RepID=UPI0029668065|nr:GNAT family acetyltransferase [Reichenbachiella sp.]MDW3209858.1 GNAT family acetyltransferase [Reichenbachiella sp.]